MKHTAAENDIIFSLRMVIKDISLEETYIHLIVFCQAFGLFDPLLRHIECSDGIPAFGHEDSVFALSAADIQHPVRFHRGQEFHDIVANPVWRKSPVILFLVVPAVIVCYYTSVAKQSVHSGMKRCRQPGEHLDVGITTKI